MVNSYIGLKCALIFKMDFTDTDGMKEEKDGERVY